MSIIVYFTICSLVSIFYLLNCLSICLYDFIYLSVSLFRNVLNICLGMSVLLPLLCLSICLFVCLLSCITAHLFCLFPVWHRKKIFGYNLKTLFKNLTGNEVFTNKHLALLGFYVSIYLFFLSTILNLSLGLIYGYFYAPYSYLFLILKPLVLGTQSLYKSNSMCLPVAKDLDNRKNDVVHYLHILFFINIWNVYFIWYWFG